MCEKINIYFKAQSMIMLFFKLKWISIPEWMLPARETLQHEKDVRQMLPLEHIKKNGCDWNNDCIVRVWNSFAAAEESEADTKKITS